MLERSKRERSMRLLFAALVSCVAASAVELLASRSYAHEYTVGAILVVHPTITPPARGRATTAGYLTLRNGSDQEDRLLSAASSAARAVEIHETRMNPDGMMQMRRA